MMFFFKTILFFFLAKIFNSVQIKLARFICKIPFKASLEAITSFIYIFHGSSYLPLRSGVVTPFDFYSYFDFSSAVGACCTG